MSWDEDLQSAAELPCSHTAERTGGSQYIHTATPKEPVSQALIYFSSPDRLLLGKAVIFHGADYSRRDVADPTSTGSKFPGPPACIFPIWQMYAGKVHDLCRGQIETTTMLGIQYIYYRDTSFCIF